MQEWKVSAAVIERGDHVLLVANRRRGGSVDWTTPGGVVDEGESVLGALEREVVEETGLVVSEWSSALYEVDVVFVDMGSHLRVVTHRATVWSGELVVDDPDGIVIDADWSDVGSRAERLASSPRWVSEPLLGWLADPSQELTVHNYRVQGRSLTDVVVHRL